VKVFLDSSSFAKRFINELGSEKVEEICAEATQLGLSVLCVPEITSALNRRRREKTLTRREYYSAKRRLFEDVSDADIINLTSAVVAACVIVLEEGPVRTLDALHVACALEWGAELFISFDQRQLEAARRAGLKTRKT